MNEVLISFCIFHIFFLIITFYRAEVNSLQLRAGSSKCNSGGILYPVSKDYIHQSFQLSTMDYDIAILKVKPSFAVGSTFIREVKLPEIGYNPKVGSHLLVSGWGVLAVS